MQEDPYIAIQRTFSKKFQTVISFLFLFHYHCLLFSLPLMIKYIFNQRKNSKFLSFIAQLGILFSSFPSNLVVSKKFGEFKCTSFIFFKTKFLWPTEWLLSLWAMPLSQEEQPIYLVQQHSMLDSILLFPFYRWGKQDSEKLINWVGSL